jgi:tRNA-Thr(GGU) m(6)t(6)A37 methyltransferase TsaA
MSLRSYIPIGTLETCFTEKFGAPRQALMVGEARGVLKLRPEPSFREALRGLETFSHVWVIYVFDRHIGKPWRPTIRPPRIGGPKRVGVLASRSPHRPNPIGLSAVKLDRIDYDGRGGIEIHLSGVDILNGTPVLDIKPYLPYADLLADAHSGWAQGEIERYPVEFPPEIPCPSHLRGLVTQMLEWDPRPRPQRETMPFHDPTSEGRRFAFRVSTVDVHWEIRNGGIRVLEVILIES